jgi:hypothetical protein
VIGVALSLLVRYTLLVLSLAEWARGANPVSCKWVKQTGPAKGFDFDVSKVE